MSKSGASVNANVIVSASAIASATALDTEDQYILSLSAVTDGSDSHATWQGQGAKQVQKQERIRDYSGRFPPNSHTNLCVQVPDHLCCCCVSAVGFTGSHACGHWSAGEEESTLRETPMDEAGTLRCVLVHT
jgi:hypothetical protein